MVPGSSVPGMTQIPHVPNPQEIATLHPGSYETPIGTLVKLPDGTSHVVLNQQGQSLYRQRFAESVNAFGQHPFANDPNAPPPPVNPNGPAYNPFSGQWAGSTPKAPGVR